MTEGRGIVERADALRVEIERLPVLREAAKNSEAVATRAGQLGELASTLQIQAERLRLFRDRGLKPFIPPERPAELLTTTREHRARFEEDRTAIARDPSDSGFKWRYHDDLVRLRGSIERALGSTWNDHLDSLVPNDLDERLELLGRVPALRQRVAQAREIQGRLEAARTTIPGSAGEFDEVEAIAGTLNENLESLREIPEDVREFLLAASSGGAPLGALTSAVRAWLEEHGFVESLRYVLRAGP